MEALYEFFHIALAISFLAGMFIVGRLELMFGAEFGSPHFEIVAIAMVTLFWALLFALIALLLAGLRKFIIK